MVDLEFFQGRLRKNSSVYKVVHANYCSNGGQNSRPMCLDVEWLRNLYFSFEVAM